MEPIDAARRPQMEDHNLIDKLNIRGNKLSKSHRKIADYIVNHYDKAVFLTAVSLGEAVGVSESTVVRFASALGFSGYPQMQEALQELVRHRLTTEQRFEMSENIEQDSVLTTVLKMDMQNIRNTISMIDHKAFAEAVNLLLHARRIYILGLRSAAPLAHFLGYYLHFIFDDVVIVAEGTTDVFESISRINSHDVLVGISFPRYSTRTLEAMQFAGAAGAQVIGITDGEMSPLQQVSSLCLSARTDMASFVDSLAAPLSLINALLVALALQKKDEVNIHFKRLEEIWDAYRVYSKDQQ